MTANVPGTSRVSAILGLILVVAGCGNPPTPPPVSGAGVERPNVVVVVVDDLRWDEFHAGGHPYLETPNIDRLASEGARFVNSFHAVPLCSPNRATLLTGQFPSRHGIIDNVARDLASHRLETFNIPMKAAGYRTAFVGKWHMGNDPTPRPGFDYWVAIPGQGRSTNPELFEDGALHKVPGYTTDLLTDRAVAFIEREHAQPFLLYLAQRRSIQTSCNGTTGQSTRERSRLHPRAATRGSLPGQGFHPTPAAGRHRRGPRGKARGPARPGESPAAAALVRRTRARVTPGPGRRRSAGEPK